MTIGSWDYYPKAKSVLIDTGTDKILCNEVYIDDNVLVFKKDGTQNDLIVFANENNIPNLDAYSYLTNLLFENTGIKYIKLSNDKVLMARTSPNYGITVGVPVSYDTGIKPMDGKYAIDDGKIIYEIVDGKIIAIKNYRFCEIEHGESLVVEVDYYNKFKIGLTVIYYKKPDMVVTGSYNILVDDEKMQLNVNNGKLESFFYVKEHSLNEGRTIVLLNKYNTDFEEGAIALINNQIAPNNTYKSGDYNIKIKNGKVKKYYDSRISGSIVILLTFFILIILFVTLGQR